MSEKKRLTFDDFEEITQLKQKIIELQTKRGSMQAELSARMSAHAEAQRANPIEDGARALLDGRNPAEAIADRKELTATSQKIQIFERAEDLCKNELRKAELKASKAICAAQKPEFKGEWEEFARLLVATSEQATKLDGMYGDLRSRGIHFAGHLVVSGPLGPWSALDRDGPSSNSSALEKAPPEEVPRGEAKDAEAAPLQGIGSARTRPPSGRTKPRRPLGGRS